MFYLCRYSHWTEDHNQFSSIIFCAGCRKAIHKTHTYMFRKEAKGRIYLARQSKKRTQTKLDYMKWYRRNYRDRINTYLRQYRRKKKEQKLLELTV